MVTICLCESGLFLTLPSCQSPHHTHYSMSHSVYLHDVTAPNYPQFKPHTTNYQHIYGTYCNNPSPSNFLSLPQPSGSFTIRACELFGLDDVAIKPIGAISELEVNEARECSRETQFSPSEYFFISKWSLGEGVMLPWRLGSFKSDIVPRKWGLPFSQGVYLCTLCTWACSIHTLLTNLQTMFLYYRILMFSTFPHSLWFPFISQFVFIIFFHSYIINFDVQNSSNLKSLKMHYHEKDETKITAEMKFSVMDYTSKG